ncbi:peptide ABC transporter substrate-binding protein [Streptococcus pseudoporcinus]|uniref:Peptide binding protein n=1 Tax=Streptococcus pseudoporcinus TaxID=361101 RepID=A0A4U9YC91_9STRE|nr:peptide ABC transporter substrate-binding protein [Streptococcus pseudoporcinus]VTS23666.1 peptide binding protein [Streptococcus pseudoporcinus]VUC70749.1 peptide binding protein [Streptococcus pseudoporcinus]VUD00485.1 peptide binding protein [Streptococcus pseudoporcinus]VUD00860.1 peptide binding protein [Streptococcus pseudoporcinus]
MNEQQKAKWKRVGLGAMTLASATLLIACGNKSTTKAGNKDEINWYTPTEIISLDISKNTDSYSSLAIGNSESNLLRVDDKGKLQPDLAKKVDVSKDGLTYTATLRDGLKWSDGSELTAKDFVYSWKRIVDPATASEYAYLTFDAHLKNAEEINSGKNKDLDSLGVKAEGNKVIFTLSKPSPQFKSLLSFASFMPQKEEFVKKAGKDYGTSSDKQIYSGPYTVEKWNGTSGTFKLVKNKNYWNAKAVKTKVVNVQTVKKPDTAVQMYKQGKLDLANISATSAIYNANKKNKDIVDVPEATTAYMVYNQTGKVPVLSNTKIRQALNLATDRKGIVAAAVDTGSKPATAIAPTGLAKLKDGSDLTKYVAPGYKYDEKGAAKLFKEGLKELGKDSAKITVTADADSPVAKATVDYIKETWEKALPGLTVEEKFVTFKQRLEDTKNQNFDVALALWGGDYPEGSTFYGLFTSDAAYNYGKFASQEYDAAYKKAITADALDVDAAAHDYKDAEKVLYDNAYYNPVYFRTTQALQNPSIKGLVRNSTGLNVDFTYAYKK